MKEIAEVAGEIKRDIKGEITAGEIAVPVSSAAGVVDLRSSSAPAARGGTPLYYPLASSSVPPNR